MKHRIHTGSRTLIFSVSILLITIVCGCGYLLIRPMEGTDVWVISVDGVERTFLVHVPEVTGNPAPVLFAFHGGYGTAAGMENKYGLTSLSEEEGFIVVYPQGLQRHWQDGRVNPDDISDVDFIAAVLDTLTKSFDVDSRRIYATGMSNGAMFCHFLAVKLPGVFSGIAPVCGGLADPGVEWLGSTSPVDVCILQGTADPLVPYQGGDVGGRETRGKVLSTDETVSFWCQVNGCTGEPVITQLPDQNTDPDDGCTVTLFQWSGVRDVALYRIEGGGHTWPGGEQYLPVRTVGRVCGDIHAPEIIWAFFSERGTDRNFTVE